MFAITCGLNHSAVMRLKNSRQRLPPKYTKLLEELTQVIVPDRNFSRYRNLISNASVSHTCYNVPIYSAKFQSSNLMTLGKTESGEDLRSISHFNFYCYPTLLKSFSKMASFKRFRTVGQFSRKYINPLKNEIK